MNSGFHYMYNSSKKVIGRCTNPIEIGAYNWIGNRSTIFGGCQTKDFTIVAARSLVNKDFTKEKGEFMMLAGLPTKLVATGIKRVFLLSMIKRFPNGSMSIHRKNTTW